jgi:sugar O-acyltransferase (sialic acid O-acetyltransferase NeuD family)
MEKPVLILGTGPIGRSALNIFKSNGVLVFGFLEEGFKASYEIEEIPVLGNLEKEDVLKEIGKSAEVFIAEDENTVRRKLIDGLKEDKKVMPVNAIHDSAIVPESVDLGHGNLFDAGLVIGAGSKVGSGVILNANVTVGAETKIGDLVQIGLGSNIGSAVEIADEVFIGSGVTVVSGIKLGKRARIGAGSVVVEDVAKGQTMFGNPAKKMG